MYRSEDKKLCRPGFSHEDRSAALLHSNESTTASALALNDDLNKDKVANVRPRDKEKPRRKRYRNEQDSTESGGNDPPVSIAKKKPNRKTRGYTDEQLIVCYQFTFFGLILKI